MADYQKPKKSPSLGSGMAEKAKKSIQDRQKNLDKEIDKYSQTGTRRKSA